LIQSTRLIFYSSNKISAKFNNDASFLSNLVCSSPIQTLTVGTRLSLVPPQNAGHGLQLLIVTVGRELHPAPKKPYSTYSSI